MPTLSPALKEQTDAQPTKAAWSAKVEELLGPTRRLRCFRDDVEFLNVASSGPFKISAGDIMGFGLLSDSTVRLAADLSTGTCTMRLEGNGHTITYSLGLPGSGKEFTLPANPTGSPYVGFAFTRGAGTRAPRFLPSGTGPLAPSIDAETPTIVELVDWRNPANPVVVGVSQYTTQRRLDDIVYQHPEMAADKGDTAMFILEPITWDTGNPTNSFKLGGPLLLASRANTVAGTRQLEQMLLSFKPWSPGNRWSTYPFMDTYVRANYPIIEQKPYEYATYGPCSNPDVADSTYPPPFKVNLYTPAGYKNGAPDRVPTFTHEIKAFNGKPDLPVNSPLCSQVWNEDEPLVPHFNCGMTLPWTNQQTRLSANYGKYHNGVQSYAYTVGAAKSGPSANPCIPLVGMSQVNSLNNWFWMPAWPMKATDTRGTLDDGVTVNINQARDIAYLAAYDAKPADPEIPHREFYYPQIFRVTGVNYQIGSISGHDWRTGNGGARFERFGVSHVMALYCSDQNWVRPLGAMPIRHLLDNWGLALFNHSNHWIGDLDTYVSMPKGPTLRGDTTVKGGYYGSGPYGAMGQSRGPQWTVDLVGIGNGDPRLAVHEDASGRLPYGGWMRDNLHACTNAAEYAIIMNSPMHAIAATHDFHTLWMVQLGSSYPTEDPTGNLDIGPYGGGYFTVRSQAWRWGGFVKQWMLGSPHPSMFTQAEIEDRFQIELETMYEKIYRPVYLDNSQHPYHVSVRNLGLPLKANGDKSTCPGGSLGLYITEILIFMKQFGLWSVMRQKNARCAAVLQMMIDCWDKAVIDYCLDTDMRDNYYPIMAMTPTPTPADIPANWAAQKVMLDTYYPPQGPSEPIYWYTDGPKQFRNFTQRTDGTYGEQFGCPHLYYQYMCARRDFFQEYANARIPLAIAKMKAYYAAHDAGQAAGKAYPWAYLFPQSWERNPPTEVGPV